MNVGTMLNNKKVLLNGCSFSRGPGSWPYHLQKKTGCKIINLACAAAGNIYIHHSTINELVQRNYDLVIIMWSGLERYDFKTSYPELFHETPYTSRRQSELNDWPDKVIEEIDDRTLIEKDWVFAYHYTDPVIAKMNVSNAHFKFMGDEQRLFNNLILMITLQEFLKSKNIPYVFCLHQNYLGVLKRSHLFNSLDISKWALGDNLYSITHRLGSFDTDQQHPGPAAHDAWADILVEHIKKIYDFKK